MWSHNVCPLVTFSLQRFNFLVAPVTSLLFVFTCTDNVNLHFELGTLNVSKNHILFLLFDYATYLL